MKPESGQIDTDRIEDKYIVPKDCFVEAKEVIQSELPPYFPEPETIYTINRSIYFDSPDFTFLKQHLSGLDNRRKIRIRCYAPNGTPNHIYFIEIKAKNNGDSTKTRLQLSEAGYNYVMAHSQIDINDDLLSTNQDMGSDDEVLQQAKLINYLLHINKCRPVCDIVYKRYAHQKDEDLRVTMDTNLKVKPLQLIKDSQIKDLQNLDLYDTLIKYGEKYSNADNFILEVKHQDKEDLPPWLDQLLEKMDADECSFSKYVWAMAKIIEHSIHIIGK